jgi:hypothetical protein
MTLGPRLTNGNSRYWLANLTGFSKLNDLSSVASIEHHSPKDRDRRMYKGHDILCRNGHSFHLGDLKSRFGSTTLVSRDPFGQ